MHDANVGVTLRVLDAFATAGLDRLVAYRPSTCPAIRTVGSSTSATDATWRTDSFSYYDETKYLAIGRRSSGSARAGRS